MKSFEIHPDEHQLFVKWDEEHKPVCPLKGNVGAIGGRLTFRFTPTGLGPITSVKCACGEKITLTNFEDW